MLVDNRWATPAIDTNPLTEDVSANAIRDALQQYGLLVSYQSEYLVSRNWLQIGLMGHCTIEHLERLLDVLAWLTRPLMKASALPELAGAPVRVGSRPLLQL
jgi:hypothetical protein